MLSAAKHLRTDSLVFGLIMTTIAVIASMIWSGCKPREEESGLQDAIARDAERGVTYYLFEDEQDIVWVYRCNDNVSISSLADLEKHCPDKDEKGLRYGAFPLSFMVDTFEKLRAAGKITNTDYNDFLSGILNKNVNEKNFKPHEISKKNDPAIFAAIDDLYGKRQLWIPLGQTMMKFAFIMPGTFQMGSPGTEADRGSDEKQHPVRISNAFYMQTTEVTQEQWIEVMGDNPSSFKNCGQTYKGIAVCANHPVERVSWNDIQEFLKKLNGNDQCKPYCLPTEAQWEYAARAGTTTPFNLGENISTDKVNYNGNYPYKGGPKGIYREKTVAAESLNNANSWHLSDMHGNVWEWVRDWYDSDYYSTPEASKPDPTGPAGGSNRVIRGGGWDDIAQGCRSAFRGSYGPGFRSYLVGFRLLRTIN